MMEVDTVASHALAANVVPCVHEAKKFFRFVTTKELRVQKLGYPIHLVGVGQVKRDLNVLIGVLNHDDAIIVNVPVLPFAFEEDDAARLYFGCPEVGRLKK
jgi:hypothetical protein